MQEPREDLFFAVVGRGRARTGALAAEFAERDVSFGTPLSDTEDMLRGFEIADPVGYIVFFGRPL